MAAPITHIVLADKVFNKHFLKEKRNEFMVGTSFPDIRYLGVIKRSETHFFGLKMKDLEGNSSFMKGMKFHSIVDEVREKFMRENDYYAFTFGSDLATQVAKIYEDRLLKEKIGDWEEISGYFDYVYGEEKGFGVLDKDIKRWHKALKDHFKVKVKGNEDIYQFASNIGQPKEVADEMVRVLEKSNLEKARKIVFDFYNKFESLL